MSFLFSQESGSLVEIIYFNLTILKLCTCEIGTQVRKRQIEKNVVIYLDGWFRMSCGLIA